ncbi:MAG TPA: ATP-binding protein [Methylomirabilota bacterium]|nr:ATP-binding protein [Methylomirabilota bacterium]
MVTEYGYFWAVEYLSGGKPGGMIFAYAKNGEVVKDKTLLENLAGTNASFKELNFLVVLEFGDQTEKVIQTIDAKDCKLNKEYLDQINDLGMKFIHPNKDNLVLDDIFTYPDLEDVESEDNKKINSNALLDLGAQYNKCVIFGEDLAGKTSLALTLQKNLNEKGMLPLYIKAEEIKHSDFSKFSELLVRNFEKQYSNDPKYIEAFTRIFAEERQRLIIIIDNFESLAIKRITAQMIFFKNLKEIFENIFLFANMSIEIEVMAKSESKEMLQGFKVLGIKQLGHVLRDELIEKWLTVEQKETLSDGYLLSQKNEISQKIKIAVGVNFIPTYPLYLLTILQLIVSGNKNKLQGSSYAELYRYLINQALGSVNARAEDLDFYHTYLSYIAHYFFIRKTKELSVDEMMKMYDEYKKMMDIEKSFVEVHRLLIRAKILKNEGGSYSFNHNYSYYFFVAKYLSDNLETLEIKKELAAITEQLYRSEFANILIFLVHHSKNKDIIDQIIQEAKKLFYDVKPYTLSKEEIWKINDMINGEITLSIVDSNPIDNRKKDLERRDRFEEEKRQTIDEIVEGDDEDESLDFFGKIILSFKLIEVLGQITNNYYGSLDGEKKADILDEIYSLGFRGLRALLEDIEEYLEIIRRATIYLIEKKGASTKIDKEKIADKLISSFIEIIAFAFVKRISDSVASKNLFPTTNKVMERNQTSAAKLMNIAVRLNFPNELLTNKNMIIELNKEFTKNYLTKKLLRMLVIDHLYKFEVKYSDKQSICDKLDINITRNKQRYHQKSQ